MWGLGHRGFFQAKFKIVIENLLFNVVIFEDYQAILFHDEATDPNEATINLSENFLDLNFFIIGSDTSIAKVVFVLV